MVLVLLLVGLVSAFVLVLGRVGGVLVGVLLRGFFSLGRLTAAPATATATATARGPVPVLVRLVALVLGLGFGLQLVLVLGLLLSRGCGSGRPLGGRLGLRGLTATAATTTGAALRRGLGDGCRLGSGLVGRGGLLDRLDLFLGLVVARGVPAAAAAAAAVSGVWNIGSAKTGAWKTATAGRVARRLLPAGSSTFPVNSGLPAAAVARRR